MTAAPPVAARRGTAHLVLRFLGRTSLTLVLLTLCYYALPAHGPFHDVATGARWAGSAVALVGFVLLVRRSLRAAQADRTVAARAEAVLTVLYVLVLLFAVTYNVIALQAPEQFDGIETQTDALYFTVTVIATVGFGDITAVGTFARLVVTAQMLVNLVYVGTALRVLTSLGTSHGTDVEDAPAPAGRPQNSPATGEARLVVPD
ncbi:potassium channel family protein [Cellulomonas sp. S1-8]|uniref:potassium channel family protein n=1 Tax=Cellulomonas sp. S1-8 TaxID=2904790 RepID=UPI0022446461|nr:potassium channel family protein [Cellulomonas sp. S1-8]UZN03674.1 potassium channel family protein [Cellulomonas sp. S1-8]